MAAMFALLWSPVWAAATFPVTELRPDSLASFQDHVVAWSAEILASAGWILDVDGATVRSAAPVGLGRALRLRAKWSPSDPGLNLPLAFDAEPMDTRGAPIPVWVTGRLSRDVLTLRRATPRGANLECGQVSVVRKPASQVPPGALPAPCELAAGSQALRPLGVGDVLRTKDIGVAPDILAYAKVQVQVRIGEITVQTHGTALTDGVIGQSILVRPSGQTQALKGLINEHKIVVMTEVP